MSTPAPKNLNNTYIPPRAPYLRPILICGVVMALSTQRSLIAPGSLVHDNLLTQFSSPATAFKYAGWVQNALFYFLFGAHAVETVMFMGWLRRHGVQAGSGAWWKWVGTCYVGGKFCMEHFEKVVKAVE